MKEVMTAAGSQDDPLMFADREDWRAWLEDNHDRDTGVWLAYYKKDAGKQSITYEEAVEEDVCFGWVDSNVRTIDAERYMQWHSPRKKSSTWSASNKERVRRMIMEGRMTEYGMAVVKEAQKSGHWDELTPVENLEMPPDLEAALAANPQAAGNYEAMSESNRKMYLYWVASAKTDETRKKRIKKTIKRLALNKKMGE